MQFYLLIKKFQKEIEKEREIYNKNNEKLIIQLKTHALAAQNFTVGAIEYEAHQYGHAICSYLKSANKAFSIKDKEILDKSLNHALSLIKEFNDIIIVDKKVIKLLPELKEILVAIPDERAIKIYNILNKIPNQQKD